MISFCIQCLQISNANSLINMSATEKKNIYKHTRRDKEEEEAILNGK